MSKFKTSIPVDIGAIKNALPPRSFVNSVVFDGERVTVEWENDHFKTPYTFSVDWPNLNQVPAGVRNLTPGSTAPLSGPQTSSPSPVKVKADDAAPVKKKAAGKP